MPKVLLEDDLKQAVLQHISLYEYLGDLGRTKVIFEKSVNYGKLIADALVFTDNKGIIGVEIKTEADTLRRLSHQLENYVEICQYVFVFVHSSHLAGVIRLLSKYHYYQVGIIVYDQFGTKVIPGLYREAYFNQEAKLYHALSLLWTKEIRSLLSIMYNQQQTVKAEQYKLKHKFPSLYRQGDIGHHTDISKSLPRSSLIDTYCGIFGYTSGIKIICQVYLDGALDPLKQLQVYNFNDSFNGDISYKIPYKKKGKYRHRK